jgi:hypothetical protein
MSRTFSVLGLVMFTVGVVALSSLARQSQPKQFSVTTNREPSQRGFATRRIIPAFAFDSPFSLN